jgi:hypothetical protein
MNENQAEEKSPGHSPRQVDFLTVFTVKMRQFVGK